MSERFLTEGGIVTDTKTGLQWESQHRSPMTWDEAVKYAESLRLGDHDDWRLPIVEELFTLIDFSKISPASAFPKMQAIRFWSSSSYSGSSSSAWGVNFYYGNVVNLGKSNYFAVRCVRRGADRILQKSFTGRWMDPVEFGKAPGIWFGNNDFVHLEGCLVPDAAKEDKYQGKRGVYKVTVEFVESEK